MALLKCDNLAFPGRLSPLSGEVRPGELVHLVGPNGAGKSTLLGRLSGLLDGPGTLIFSGQSLEQIPAPLLAQQRAFLTQHQIPPFAMPVWHYLSLHTHGAPIEKMRPVLQALWLEDKLARRVSQLSGGEWQRVRLAAVILQVHPAITPHGRLLLLDEPMNSLDVAQQAGLNQLLAALCAAGLAVIMTNHDLNLSLHYAQTVWLLHQGVLIARGPADEVLRPDLLDNAYGATFRRIDVPGHKVLICS